MKRLKEICAIIAHAEAIQADPKYEDVRITVEVLPLRRYGIGVGFFVWLHGKLDETIVITSQHDFEDLKITTVQEVIDLMTDTVRDLTEQSND